MPVNASRVLALTAAAVILAGCGGSASPSAPPPQSANALVCRHYLAQRAWVKNLTYPTTADAVKFAGYVGADDGQATPGTKLRRDLDAMVTAIKGGHADYAASKLVYEDCA